MISKISFVNRVARENKKFMAQFDRLVNSIDPNDRMIESAIPFDPKAPARGKGGDAAPRYPQSQLYHLYVAGVTELQSRFEAYRAAGRPMSLTPQSLSAIRATVEARLVREIQRCNSQMVVLTIAIAGGPFLGLLGTVVGVMITFAAIAAAGDVNVNAIAPGIAAALVATVAGLAVAIPALFGYNYLTGRIQSLVSDMQVFVDELSTRFAENHST
jgi:biopolymer transport protein ExbB